MTAPSPSSSPPPVPMPEPGRRWLDEHALPAELLIGLISDTHIPEARPALFDEVYAAFRGVDLILHAGDIHDLAVLDWLEQRCGVPVLAVCGNGDDGSGGRPVAPEDHRLPYNQLLVAGGERGGLAGGDALRIGMTHAFPEVEIPGSATTPERMARHFGGPVDVVVAGDTHVPGVWRWPDEATPAVTIVNSGSPTFPWNLGTQLGTVGFLQVRAPGFEAWIEQLHAR
ncbi:MAG: metallophosphoesterase [Dehalococcoidia bacterium]